MRNFILSIVFLFLFQNLIISQDSIKLANQKSIGVLVEYGLPYYNLPEGQRYYVLLTGFTFNFPIFKAKKNFNMSVEIFPNYGFVWLDDVNSDFEVGINFRLTANLSLSPNDVLRFKLGSGPHYISVETELQAQGFIFSDYFLLAYDRRIYINTNPFMLEFEFGYRHISNAGLNEPNRSIANFIFGLGLSKIF